MFTAISVITQVSIESGEHLFQCGYRDPPYEVVKRADQEEVEMSSGTDYASDGMNAESDDDLSYDTY